MRAVWSFWSKPHRAHQGSRWTSPRQHLLSWVLSFETARRHYPETVLCTDDEGAALLVDGLGLRFAQVTTSLNALDGHDCDWWVFGKLWAYRLQNRPFVHIDSDVYLWKPLPERLTSSPVFAQNPEPAGIGESWYYPDACEQAIRTHGDGRIPAEWESYRYSGLYQTAACCGVLGGNDVAFLRYYAGLVIDLLEEPRNRIALNTLSDKMVHNPFFEQYLLSACACYHGVRVEYLFQSLAEALLPERATEAGYTHLIASAKSNPAVAQRLERRVRQDFPDSYTKCRLLARKL